MAGGDRMVETPATGTVSTEADFAGDGGAGAVGTAPVACADEGAVDEADWAPSTDWNTGAAGATEWDDATTLPLAATKLGGDNVRRWPGQIV